MLVILTLVLVLLINKYNIKTILNYLLMILVGL